ncbi:putative Zinc metalloproteinase nas-4 [Hypsibius exemplaris]|uniref:Metalloendopeptidase n=1 Tax=Hypsibius exemplaris TaxID=2072580 RepID=A0A1W0XA19_HYPEX|nr:putative Zinc metalloproteinase nas-4 [Hypsibius exemplaris]
MRKSQDVSLCVAALCSLLLLFSNWTVSLPLATRDASNPDNNDGDGPLFSLVPVDTAKLVSENLFEGDIAGFDALAAGDLKDSMNNALRDPNMRWPNGVVPYALSKEYTGRMRRQIMDAMKQFSNKVPCVQFVPRTTEKDYLQIEPNAGCYSFVGKAGGAQVVSLSRIGCLESVGVIQHELMHSLGFYHEQSRSDRDDYLEINWGNIKKSNHDQFQSYSIDKITGFGQPYDFGSIMHYGTYDFAANQDLYAIRPKPQYSNYTLGQRRGLSPIDVAKLKIMYKCPAEGFILGSSTTTTTTTTTTSPSLVDCQVFHVISKGNTVNFLMKELEVSMADLQRLNPGRANFDSLVKVQPLKDFGYMKQNAAAAKYGISTDTVTRIKSNKEEILKKISSTCSKDAQRIRMKKYPEVNQLPNEFFDKLLILLVTSYCASAKPDDVVSTTTFIRAGNQTWVFPGDVKDSTVRYGPWNPRGSATIGVLNNFGASLATGFHDTQADPILIFTLLFPNTIERTTTKPQLFRNFVPPIGNKPEVQQSSLPSTTDTTTDESTIIVSDCIYYSDGSFTCQTECDSDVTADPVMKTFPDNKKLIYQTKNCSIDLNTTNLWWRQSDGIVDKKPSRRMRPVLVLATCTFYRTLWFECFDITDCTNGPNRCRGGNAWRGTYEGMWTTGYKGNLTAKAINGVTNSISQNNGCQNTDRRVTKYCMIIMESTENFENGERIMCNRFKRVCQSSDNCRYEVHEISNLAVPQKMAGNIENVVHAMKQFPTADFTAYCYYYTNEDFNCVFPRHPTGANFADLRCKFADQCIKQDCAESK